MIYKFFHKKLNVIYKIYRKIYYDIYKFSMNTNMSTKSYMAFHIIINPRIVQLLQTYVLVKMMIILNCDSIFSLNCDSISINNHNRYNNRVHRQGFRTQNTQ